jgi:hypothetical protein
VAHQRQPDVYFSGLQFVILVAGYDRALPDGYDTIIAPPRLASTTSASDQETLTITTRSLHIWGVADKLIRPDESKAQLCRYADPRVSSSSCFSFFLAPPALRDEMNCVVSHANPFY